MFFRRKDKFSPLLKDIADNLNVSANFFNEFEIKNISDLKVLSETMKGFENKGDTYIHEMIVELNHSLMTPFDREDILALAMGMDDVLDGLEHCSALLEMYSITKFDDFMKRFLDSIRNCTDEIKEAVELLSQKKLSQIRDHAIRIKDYESKCDGIERQSINKLFTIEKIRLSLFNIRKFMRI